MFRWFNYNFVLQTVHRLKSSSLLTTDIRSILKSVYQWEMSSLAPLKVLRHIAGQTSTTAVIQQFMERLSSYHNLEASITNAEYSWNAILAWFVPLWEISVDSLEVNFGLFYSERQSSRVGFNRLTSHQTHYRSYRGRFVRVTWPNQQCQALKDNSWSVHQVANLTRPSSLQGKVK